MPNLTVTELERKYRDSVEAHQTIFDEMKTNILLVSGSHYSKLNSKYFEKVRGNKVLNEQSKLRLTENYINKAHKIYVNNTLSFTPGTTVLPKDTKSIHDTKQAELNRSTWDDYKYEINFGKQVRHSVENLFSIGECWAKLLYDPYAGDIKGYEPLLDEFGQQVTGADGQPQGDPNKPIFTGGWVADIFPGYDAFIAKGALSIDASPFVGIKKMVLTEELEKMVEDDPNFTEDEKSSKLAAIASAAKENYSVFNAFDGSVGFPDDQTLTKEYFYRPSSLYPKGYFYITVSTAILWEGELQTDGDDKPVFPIIYALCDEFEGCARGFSPIKQGRPMQAEINRAGSKIAETQITLGDDKIYTSGTTGVTEGEKLNGIRQIKVSNAMQYQVIQGRSGEQYMPYVDKKIAAFWNIMGLSEEQQEIPEGTDLQTRLYFSMKNKKKFRYYSDKIERFLVEWTQIVLRLARAYYPDDKIVRSVGSSEAINIEEFKNTSRLCYDVKVVPSSEDAEDLMGRYLTLTQVLQYAGKNLDERTTGVLIQNMPFIDGKALAGHMTVGLEETKNINLALDRGEMPMISKYDNNETIVKELVRRMRQPDFDYIKSKNPQVEENYMRQYEERNQLINQQMEELKNANMGIIPTGGPQIRVDAWLPDPENPGKTKRASVDQVAFDWFLKRLGEQGAKLEVAETTGTQEQIDMLGNGGGRQSLSVVNGGQF